MIPTAIHQRSSLCRPRGFTLIELLVSVAVMLLLAAVLVSLSSAVVANARKAGCVNNIRIQLVGFLAFSTDHGNRYYWPASDAVADNAPEHLYPNYVGSLETLICPATTNRIRPWVIDSKTGKPRDFRNNAAHANDDRGGHSYEYFGFYTIPPNEMRFEWIGDKFHARKRPGHPFRSAHATVLVLDGDDSGINNFPDATNNHGSGGWHWGFADGHVRWVSGKETKGLLGN
jgi:prepilin-type N-terminal cleavage/methylation domain-containing protein